ncbi:MAG: hypothetical protein OEY96_13765, partial [Gammaproteobacteria bacterium]|nr:hypothetical protein [Gammaproteobacteria bacterium]
MRFFRLKSFLRFKHLIFLTAVLLYGCAGQITMVPTLSQKSVIKPDEGIVTVRIIDTSNTYLPFNMFTINPKELNESKKVKPLRLEALERTNNSAIVFASPVKAGSYSVSDMMAFYTIGEYIYRRWAIPANDFGTFEVKAGQVTDLGTILYYPKPVGDKYSQVVAQAPDSSVGEVLEKYFPFYKYSKELLLGWNDDGRDEERMTVYASIAQNPITYNSAYRAPDGSIFFPSKLGVILQRTANGEWKTDAVDTNFDLNDIKQSKRGDLIVAGDEGKLFFKAKGKNWQDLSLKYDNKIHEINFTDDKTIELVTSDSHTVYISHGTIKNNKVNWKEIIRFSSARGWHKEGDKLTTEAIKGRSGKTLGKRKIAYASVIDFDGKQYFKIALRASSGRSISKRITYIRNGTTDFTETSKDLQFAFTKMSGNTKVGMEIDEGFWSTDYYYFHYNQITKEWEKMSKKVYPCTGKQKDLVYHPDCKTKKSRGKSFSFNTLPWFKTNDIAYASVSVSGEKDEYLFMTKDGGLSWEDTKHKFPNDRCYSLVAESRNSLLVSCKGSS